jgi:tRNA modification GTPase
MGLPTDDTICAIATPAGTGGIGVFRVSGPDAFAICDKLLCHRRPCESYRGRTLHRAAVMDSDDVVDDVLIAIFHAPGSYTGDDVVEISCHGGPVPMRRILALLLANGARMAESGEFTLRAFLNGKMDLAQAEAVCDIISARTEEAHQLAQSLNAGRLSQEVVRIRDLLLGVLARIEASIDFPEDVGELNYALCRTELCLVESELVKLLSTADQGILYREGAKVALIGRPNVGKSSLMNALLRVSRAIVTPIPGTTRDVIEETLNVNGIPVRLLDTAGLRETEDIVERIGVERTKQSIAAADLVILILDASAGATAADEVLQARIADKRHLVVWNKSDLVGEGAKPAKPAGIAVSALTGFGIDTLEEAVAGALLGSDAKRLEGEQAVVTHARHRHALESALSHVRNAFETIDKAMPPDFLSIDVRGALTALGEVTGQTATDDIINEIFSRFCIGK